MSTQQSKTEKKVTGLARLKLVGILLTAIGLALGAFTLGTAVGAAGGWAGGVPPLAVYVETGAAVGFAIIGFGFLVAGAEPFEDVGSPLLQYENERHDSFDE